MSMNTETQLVQSSQPQTMTSPGNPAVGFLTFMAWTVVIISTLAACIMFLRAAGDGGPTFFFGGIGIALGGYMIAAVMLVLCEIAKSLTVLAKR